jgi:hypothetical protein
VHLVRSTGISFVTWDQGASTREAVDFIVGWGPLIRILRTSESTVRVAIRGYEVPAEQREYSVDDLGPVTLRGRARSVRAPTFENTEPGAVKRRSKAKPPRTLPEFLAGLAPDLTIDAPPFDASLRRHGIEPPSATALTAEWWRPLLLEAIRALVAAEGTPFVPLLDRANWQIEHVHSQFARRVHRIAVRAVPSRLRRKNLGEGLGVYLGSAVYGAVDDTFAGRHPSFAAGDSTITPINTVAAIERARLHTFLGPAGLEEFYGRLDLRILPHSWIGELCPVETPESEKIGFVRYRSIAGHLDHAAPGASTEEGDRHAPGVGALGEFGIGAALVPAVDHNDPTRTSIAAKMMRQAVRMPAAEAPRIRSGAEAWIAEHAGVARAPISGTVTTVSPGLVVVGGRGVAFGPAEHDGRGVDSRWKVRIAEGAWVNKGDLIAHAPDVRVTEVDGQLENPCLALGVDALVALLPWKGWNFEDGIVVSESFSRRLASEHPRRISVPLGAGAIVEDLLVSEQLGGSFVPAGTELFAISREGGDRRVFLMPEDGFVPGRARSASDELVGVRQFAGAAELDIVVQRSLSVGDKLATRHGGKGVVTRIEADSAMPRFDGRTVEVLVNPVSVIRRLTIGTYVELAAGLADLLSRATGPTGPTEIPRGRGAEHRRLLARRLKSLGAEGGRMPVTIPSAPDETAVSAVVGVLHLLKLDHLAAAKAGARAETTASPVTLQPTRASSWGTTRRLAAPQRLGEMELWGLQASGADQVVADLLHERGEGDRLLRGVDRDAVPAGLRSVSTHLAIAGCQLQALLAPPDAPARWTDLAFTSSTPLDQVADLRQVYIGASALPAAVEAFAWASVDASIGDARAAKARAREIVDALLDERSIDDLAPGAPEPQFVADDGAYRALVLSCPARHPWGYAPLNWIAIPPVHMLSDSGGDSATGNPLRRAFERLVVAELLLRSKGAVEDRGFSDALEARDSRIADLLGTIDNPKAVTVAGRLQGKYGLLRRNLLGAAAVRSARAVLVGDPTLDIEHVALPRWMIAELMPAEGASEHDGVKDVVFINRQPTLLPNTIIALRAIAGEHDVVAVHPHHVAALAGDFDGDTVAVHRPVTQAARLEVWDRRRPAASLRSPARGDLLVPLSLDIALGASIATSAEGGAAQVAAPSLRRGGSSRIEGLVSALGRSTLANPALVRDAVERLVGLAGEHDVDARRASLSMLADFYRLCFDAAGTWSPAIIDLETGGRDLSGRPDLALAEQAEVIGSADDLEQLLIGRGDVRLPTRVQPGGRVAGAYLDGITPADYALAAQAAVSSLAAKKLVTPAAGALTRALVTVGYEERIVERCGLGDSSHTVLDCTGDYPCVTAYGPDRETGGTVAVGRRVGILAAMAIGERSTQLALKSIHQRADEPGALFDVVKRVRSLLVGQESVTVGSEPSDDAALTALLRRRAEAVGEILTGKLSVDAVHVLVLLRVHLRAMRSRRDEEIADSPRHLRPLSAFERAVLEGSLVPLTKDSQIVQFNGDDYDGPDLPPNASTLVSLVSGRIGR